VTSIGGSAFYGCRSLAEVVIPDSVTSIGWYAFYDCSNLASVVIGNSVQSIGGYAFYYCSNLVEMEIPASVTSIGKYAFSYCTSLATELVIPDGVTSIEDEVFHYCRSLTKVVIPNSVTSIGREAFYLCSSLTKVVIPDSVQSIGGSAFAGCFGLTELVISNSITSIEESAFASCYGLTKVVIPGSVTKIGRGAFYNCNSLTNMEIPDSVTSIGEYAFSYCNSLTSVVVIGDNLTSIGNIAFDNCANLSGIYFTGVPPELAPNVFSGYAFTVYYIYGTEGWGEEYGGRPTAVWTNKVNFDGNGGTPGIAEQTYNAGFPYGELPTADREGFDFAGWWTEDDTQVDDETQVPLLTNEYTLYAKWASKYIVNFCLGGPGARTGGGALQQEILEGMDAEEPEFDVKPGWSFVGWDGDFQNITAAATIRAIYSYTYQLADGWNLIDINLNLDDESKEKLLNKKVMTLDAKNKTYVFNSDLTAAQACWLFCQGMDEITLSGTALEAEDFHLKQRWNFVGPLYQNMSDIGPVDWGWRKDHFYPAKELLPGHGYWLYWLGNREPDED
jgi:uncharacterized repeat protein (TIGR02543 family)